MRIVAWVVVVVMVVSGVGMLSLAKPGWDAGFQTGSTHPILPRVLAPSGLASPFVHGTWTQLNITYHPANRDQIQMAYDPTNAKVVLFGGYDPRVRADGDTWVFHAGNWTNLTGSLTKAPPGRWAAGFAYVPGQKGLVLFGGRNTTQFFNDTWVFNGTAWRQVISPVAPSPRSGVAMTYDSHDGYLLLFGGGQGNVPAGSGSPWTFYNETWVLSHSRWMNVTGHVHGAPAPRFDMVAAFDPGHHDVLLEGGETLGTGGVTTWHNDTWTFTNATWTLRAPPRSPPALYGPALTWDQKLKSAVLIGENQATGFDPTWGFSGVTWTNDSPVRAASPATRGNVGFAYDAADGYLVLFGGNTPLPSYAYRSDTWTFV